jgi:hypothetical protein
MKIAIERKKINGNFNLIKVNRVFCGLKFGMDRETFVCIAEQLIGEACEY